MKTTATFVDDGKPDTIVRVAIDGHQFGFSITQNGVQLVYAPALPNASQLQIAESLQFIADTLSTQIPGRLTPFVRGWINQAADIHHTAKEKGFWEDGEERNDSEMIMLMVTELAEAVEGLREGNPPDDKVPEFSAVEAELADAVIRIMDYGHARGFRVAQAIEAKSRFNTTRPYKHNKEF